MKCRSCNQICDFIFLDLGNHPPANNYLKNQSDLLNEFKVPLQIFFCENCYLVQTKDFVQPKDLFSNEYAYLSSVSKSWLKHNEKLKNILTKKFKIQKKDSILEIACNDGYLLDFFIQDGFENCLGLEPTKIASKIAKNKNIDVIEEFFSFKISENIKRRNGKFKLVIANNVVAHVNDLNDFIKGVKNILALDGIISFEFAHLFQYPCHL